MDAQIQWRDEVKVLVSDEGGVCHEAVTLWQWGLAVCSSSRNSSDEHLHAKNGALWSSRTLREPISDLLWPASFIAAVVLKGKWYWVFLVSLYCSHQILSFDLVLLAFLEGVVTRSTTMSYYESRHFTLIILLKHVRTFLLSFHLIWPKFIICIC